MNLFLFALGLLVRLTGGLRPTDTADAAELDLVRRLIARCALLGQDEPFFATTDLAQHPDASDVEEAELSALRRLCEDVQADLTQFQMLRRRVYRREVPVVAEIAEASPAWAAGCLVSQSYGPFTTPDNRSVWFSAIDTDSYLSVFGPGSADPVLLLPHVAIRGAPTDIEFPSGSAWISARLLSSEAPADGYCGLRLERARLRLDLPPVIDTDAVHVLAGTGFHIDFELDQRRHQERLGESALHPGRTAASLPSSFRLVVAPTETILENVSDANASVFGTDIALGMEAAAPPRYDPVLERVLIPLMHTAPELHAELSTSEFHLGGQAKIREAAWAWRVARPTLPVLGEASGAGEIALVLSSRLRARWSNLPGSARLSYATLLIGTDGSSLAAKAVVVDGGRHQFALWNHAASRGARCTLEFAHGQETTLQYHINSDGAEVVAASALCQANLDRPVTTSGTPLRLFSLSCRVLLFWSPTIGHGFQVWHVAATSGIAFRPLGLCFALRNGVLRADTFLMLVAGGSIDPDGRQVRSGSVSLLFGVSSVLPILPDPYAANVEATGAPMRSSAGGVLWCRIAWEEPDPLPQMRLRLVTLDQDAASLNGLLTAPLPPSPPVARPSPSREINANIAEDEERERRLRAAFDDVLGSAPETVLLLDVSSNADQLGVGLGLRAEDDTPSQALVRDLDLVTLARDVRVVMPPQVQWEPVWTVQNPLLTPFPSPLASGDDGGPSLLGINTVNLVPIDPTRALQDLVAEHSRRDPLVAAAALFTLPFGLKVVAAPLGYPVPTELTVPRAELELVQPQAGPQGLVGGLQVRLTAVDPLSGPDRESPGFFGGAVQLRNGVDPATGTQLGLSVLSDKGANTVESTFNAEFAPGAASARVPLTRVDLSGYGASTFSRWSNPDAATAETSQVRFDLLLGRTAHEVVQIRSILYPWAVNVVRTVTIERAPSGGVFRRDSGWVAISDGVFDFANGSTIETHPGLVKGAFNVRRFRDTTHIYEKGNVRLAAVRFDADMRVADVTVGGREGLVTSVDQVGFVQLSPKEPLSPEEYAALLAAEGPLGGPVDCVVDIGNSGQTMLVSRVDVAAAPNPAGTIEFAACARGSPALPRDGQWTVVRQPVDPNADCLPADPHRGVPLVRKGLRTVSEAANAAPYLFAEPTDLLSAGNSGFHVALLWSTGTQRVLFSQPRIPKNRRAITGAVEPLLADVFATAATMAVFPAQNHCLRVPFADYVLETLGEGQLRLVLPAATFDAERVTGESRREIASNSSMRIFADYETTRVTLTLDSSRAKPWSFEQDGVTIVQELGGAEAKRTSGRVRASAEEAIRWTLLAETFGDAFAEPKDLFPLLSKGVTEANLLPSGGITVPLRPAEELNPKSAAVIEIEIPKGMDLIFATITGGHIEIKLNLWDYKSHYFSMEVVIAAVFFKVFPLSFFFKMELETLRRPTYMGSQSMVSAGNKREVILAVGMYAKSEFAIATPFPLKFKWEVFIGIGLLEEKSESGKQEFHGVIVFKAAGSVSYPGEAALVEAGLEVEGQCLIVKGPPGGTDVLVCRGKLAIELCVAVLLEIEWEIAEGKVLELPL